MAVGNFSIDFAEMQSTVDAAKRQAQQILNLLDEMNSSVQGSLAHWVGSAADSFQSTYQFCHEQAANLPGALDAAARVLDSINSNTSATESANANRFAS